MRIVFVDTTTDSQMIGGGHLILPSLMDALKKRGHEVHLVTKGKANAKLQQFIDMSGAIVHISPWKKRAPVADLVPIFNKWINSINPDVYVISNSAAIGWCVLPLLAPHIPSFTIGHNNEETYYMPVRHYHEFLSRAIGVSEEICNVYRLSCNISSDKVKWIPYGVPAATSVSSKGSVLRIIYVGRIEQEQKRISDLVFIALKLDQCNINYRLQIIGDGPYMPTVREKLTRLIKKGNVILSGWKSREEVITALRSSDVFILTSAFEGFSIALTEAMANGCCPVVTNIKAGNKQLIRNGENGYLIPVSETTAFVNILSLLAEDAEKLMSLRLSAFATGNQFSTERMAMSYETEFKLAINESRINSRVNNPNFPILPTCVSRYPSWLRRLKAILMKGHRV